MQIILNGWLTKDISLERGVRQGDPLFPLLVSLISSSPGIEGFLLPGARGLQARVRLYADDTTAILRNIRSLTNLFDCVSVNENGSGAKLNRSKTEAKGLGAWRCRSDELLGLTWVKKMKILGVVFGTIPTEHLNRQPKLEKLEKSLNLKESCPRLEIDRMIFTNEVIQGKEKLKTKQSDWSMSKESNRLPLKCEPWMVQFLRDTILATRASDLMSARDPKLWELYVEEHAP